MEKTGYWAVTAMRKTFDLVTGYGPNMNEKKWLLRIVFLETVAGVPGMVGGMVRALFRVVYLLYHLGKWHMHVHSVTLVE